MNTQTNHGAAIPLPSKIMEPLYRMGRLNIYPVITATGLVEVRSLHKMTRAEIVDAATRIAAERSA